jgi:PAS domain S-box-containing protein
MNEFEDPLNAYTAGMANYNRAAPPVAQNQDGQSVPDTTKSSLPTGGIRTAFHTGAAIAQPAKKMKTDDTATAAAAQAKSSLNTILNQQKMNYQTVQGGLSNAGVLPGTVSSIGTNGVALPVGVGIRMGAVVGNTASAQAQTAGLAPVLTATGAQFSSNNLWNFAAANQKDSAKGVASEHMIAERRQRNREHAKRSRVRKKFMLESLQEQVRQLQKENIRLRMLVQEHIPEKAMDILEECCSKNPLFDDTELMKSMGASADDQGPVLMSADVSLMKSLTSGQKCFVLSDPKLPDNPIVFATPDFYKLTGYTSDQVLGRNCRFLQGPGTDKKAVDVIRKAISAGSDATVCLLNYKADGTPFWNQFFIAALRDSDNNIVNFVSKTDLVTCWLMMCSIISNF